MQIIIFFLFLFLFCFLFLKLTDGFVNPYKLIMVFGKKGSGKTTFLTKTAINYIRKGYLVYSTIMIPGTVYFDVNDIGKYTFKPNSIVLIDEVGMIWDNRDFKSFKPEVRDFFKFQRQYKLRVYLFTQIYSEIDLKIKVLCDELYLLKNVARIFSVARRIDKRITIHNSDNGNESTIVDDYQFAPLLSPSSYIVTFIPRWVCYFNSYDPKPLPYVQGRYLVMNELQASNMFTKKWLLNIFKSFNHDMTIKYLIMKCFVLNNVKDR